MSLFLEGSRNRKLAALRLFTVQASSVEFEHDGGTKTVHVLGAVDVYAKKCIFVHLNSFYSFDLTDITAAHLARLCRECQKAGCSGIPLEIKKGRTGAKAK